MSRYARFLHRTLATDASKMTVLAGVPEKHAARAVRIYRPAKYVYPTFVPSLQPPPADDACVQGGYSTGSRSDDTNVACTI